jgi:outer membrane lipase/esterase
MGRWSNGPLWIDNVASTYGKSVDAALLGGTNYAYGGAMTCIISTITSNVPDMCVQVSEYLSSVSNKADSSAMYVIDSSAVGNEIIKVLSATVPSTQITMAAPTNIENILMLLYAAGARHFLITNVPDVGATPLIQAYGSSASVTATNLALAFNTNLSVAVSNFAAMSSNAYIYQADINGVFSMIKSTASSYGIDNLTDSCLYTVPTCGTPDNYLFWDDFHPTKKVGDIISSYVLGLI